MFCVGVLMPYWVVLHDEDNRQALLDSMADRFVEFALPCGGVADATDHHAIVACEFDAPRCAHRRQAL
jgi:hypothetical protein